MKKLVLSLFVGVLLVASCATFIPVRLMKPAKLNIVGVKKIAILDFDFTGNWHFWHEDTELTFEGIVKQVLAKKLGLVGAKATPLDPKTAYAGRLFSAKFISGLVENGHYEILEREQIQRIMEEHKLNMSGLLDEDQAAEIGKMLGVDALIYGIGNYSVHDKGDWKVLTRTVKKRYKKEDGTTDIKKVKESYKKYRAVRRVNTQLTFRVINVETGVIMAAKNLSGERRLYADRNTKQDAYSNLPDWRPMVDYSVQNIVRQAVVQIAPYQVTQRREIMKGKTDAMKRGMDYAKRGLMDDAQKAWSEALEDNSKKGKKDRVAALYNMGMYHELSGRLDQAEEKYNACYKLSRNGKFLDHRARIQVRKKELERLNTQQAE